MNRTVDLFITGDRRAALVAATDALVRGRHVLVLVRPGDARVGRRVRRLLCQAANVSGTQVTVMTDAEVVCVDGVDGVEAVVVRHARTGRLRAVNASEFLSCDAPGKPTRASARL